MLFFSSNINLVAVPSLHAILYSFADVFVYIYFAFCDEEKKLLYLICHFSA